MDLPIPAGVSQFLQSAGYYDADETGIRGWQEDNCQIIVAWNLETTRLWYSLFIASCVRVRMWLFKVCENPSRFDVRKRSSTECKFDTTGDVTDADVADLFRRKFNISIPTN